jgi:hypothetical protein
MPGRWTRKSRLRLPKICVRRRRQSRAIVVLMGVPSTDGAKAFAGDSDDRIEPDIGVTAAQALIRLS